MGTLLGAGVLGFQTGTSQAADYVYNGPASTGTAETSPIVSDATSGETITISTITGGIVTAARDGRFDGAIRATSINGDITLNLGDTVQNTGFGSAVYAKADGAGSISLAGAGNAIGTFGLNIQTDTGSITIGGSGSTSADLVGIVAAIVRASTTSDLLINRSGAITVAAGRGLGATNDGSGKVTVQRIGTVTASSGDGIQTSAKLGATLIDLTNNVSSSGTDTDVSAVYATSTTGTITIKTAAGVTITAAYGYGIKASSSGGDIDIGSTNGLGGAVTGGAGIQAIISGTGRINITSGDGVSVTGNTGAAIFAQNNNNQVIIGNAAGTKSIATSATVHFDGTGGGIFVENKATGADAGAITISTNGADGGTTTDGIHAVAASSSITISATGNVAGQSGIYAITPNGNIKVTTTAAVTGNNGYAILASNNLASVTIGGPSGTSTATNANVQIDSSAGIVAKTTSNGGNQGAIIVLTQAAFTSTGIGIEASNAGDALTIGTSGSKITNAISGTQGINATNSGNGAISIWTGAGGAITGTTGEGILTSAESGATTIDIGASSTVSGATASISTINQIGAVTIANAGTIQGSISGNAASGFSGTPGARTINNTGTIKLASANTITGFTLNNQSGGLLTGAGNFGVVNAATDSAILVGDRTLALSNGVPVMGTFSASSLTLAAGAIVDVRVDYSGVSDTVVVTGVAALNGATLNITATPKVNATWASQKTFNVLNAGTLTGTFTNVTTDYAFLKFTAAYTANGVSVTADRGLTSFVTYAKTPNQRAVAEVFDKFQNEINNPVINRVTTLTVAQTTNALEQMSGTGLAITRTQSFAAGGIFISAINTEMDKCKTSAGSSPCALSYAETSNIKSKAFDKIAPTPEPVSEGRVWAQILGGIGNMKSDATNPSQRGSNYGLAAGADTAINAKLRAGFALSLGQSTTKVSSLLTSTDSTWGQVALYAVATEGDAYLKGTLTFGYLDNKTDRTVTAFGTSDKAKGKFGANLYSLRLEAGQKFAFAPVNLTPFLAFEPSWLVQNAYHETGPSSITLGFDKTTSRALPTTLGGRIDAAYDLGDYRMTPSASLGWVHDFTSIGSISPFFTSLPGSNFTAQGARNDRNLARAELNIEAAPKNTLATIYLNARADIGARTNAVRGVAGISLRF